jgi:hypothetical protein
VTTYKVRGRVVPIAEYFRTRALDRVIYGAAHERITDDERDLIDPAKALVVAADETSPELREKGA